MNALIGHINGDTFVSNGEFSVVKNWLKENKLWYYRAFFMHDTVVLLSKKSYIAAKLRWT